MLAGETNPYSAAFIFYLLPSAVLFFIFDFLIRYTGTGVAPEMYASLRTIGALMVLSGGLWAVYENHLGRMLGFVAIQQIGSALLALSLNEVASPILTSDGVVLRPVDTVEHWAGSLRAVTQYLASVRPIITDQGYSRYCRDAFQSSLPVWC